MNPQLPYYGLLFVLSIILRTIRTYRLRPLESANEDIKKSYKWNYTHFGFELVNVSAGIFILVSESATQFVSSIMIFYVILVILSIFFEDNSVDGTIRTFGHIALSITVFIVTYYAFFKYDGLKVTTTSTAKAEVVERESQYRVALPYIDASLNRNMAVKTDPIVNLYLTTVTAKNENQAIRSAEVKFYSTDGPQPFVSKAEKNKLTMVVLNGDAVVEKVIN